MIIIASEASFKNQYAREKDDGLIKQFFFLSPKMLSNVFTRGAMPKNGRLLTPSLRCLDV